MEFLDIMYMYMWYSFHKSINSEYKIKTNLVLISIQCKMVELIYTLWFARYNPYCPHKALYINNIFIFMFNINIFQNIIIAPNEIF